MFYFRLHLTQVLTVRSFEFFGMCFVYKFGEHILPRFPVFLQVNVCSSSRLANAHTNRFNWRFCGSPREENCGGDHKSEPLEIYK